MSAFAFERSRGFSMIEVLVTVVLISIGVLGMVAMQARTVTYTQDSVQRNTAAALVDDLLEMMRADSGNVLADTGLPETNSDYYKDAGQDFPALSENVDCGTTLPDEAAQRLACWAKRAETALPGAEGLLSSDFHVCRTATPGSCTGTGSAIEIQVAWEVRAGECLDASDQDDDATTCRYRITTEL